MAVTAGNLLQSPLWDRLAEEEAPGESPQQERKKPDQPLSCFHRVCATLGPRRALMGLESSTQASPSLSGSQQCNLFHTKFYQGKDLAAVAFF